MPRTSRAQSERGVYHVILRGVNKQQIFECSADYEHFVRILQRQCGLPVETRPSKIVDGDACGVDDTPERHCFIYAWCLMGNHVHLLLKENDEPVGDVMKRISSSYVYYYNHKYDRVGHLFQERFKSQPVDEWGYFLVLLRYIHQNPLKPKLVDRLEKYRWCSWGEYLGDAVLPICSTDAVLSRVPLDELRSMVMLPLSDDEENGLLDIESKELCGELSDQKVWTLISELCGASNLSSFQALPRPQQKHILWEVHERGIGPRVLSRLTGVPYSIVQRATSAINESKSVGCGESTPEDEEWDSYLDEGDWEKYPEW